MIRIIDSITYSADGNSHWYVRMYIYVCIHMHSTVLYCVEFYYAIYSISCKRPCSSIAVTSYPLHTNIGCKVAHACPTIVTYL